MKTALLLIDIQKDYFENGKSELLETEKAASKAAVLLERYRSNGLPVIFVQHINGESSSFFVPGTEGIEISPMVAPLPGEPVIVKHAPNSFYNTNLKEILEQQQIEHLVVCGMMTHMCIDTTVRAAMDYGYKVTLIQDACTTKALTGPEGVIDARTVHNTFIAALGGVFATVKNTEEYVNELRI